MQHGEDVEAGGDNAAYRAALESWLDQALELREQHTTLDGLKSSMQDEEPSTCFPVMVCEEGDGPRTFLAAWLSMEPGDGEPSFYFQSLYFTAMDRCVDPFTETFGMEALDAGFGDGSLRLVSDKDVNRIKKFISSLASSSAGTEQKEHEETPSEADPADAEDEPDDGDTNATPIKAVDGLRVALNDRAGGLDLRV